VSGGIRVGIVGVSGDRCVGVRRMGDVTRVPTHFKNTDDSNPFVLNFHL